MNSFNPSFINAKWTILQQLEAIKKYLKDNENSIADIQSLRAEIETIKTQVSELYSEDVNLHELISQVETIAENALSLAQTNEQDIGTNDGEISTLNQQMERTLKLPLTAPSVDMIPVIKPNNSQDNIPLSSIGGGKLYLCIVNMILNNTTLQLPYNISFSFYSSRNDIFNNAIDNLDKYSKLITFLNGNKAIVFGEYYNNYDAPNFMGIFTLLRTVIFASGVFYTGYTEEGEEPSILNADIKSIFPYDNTSEDYPLAYNITISYKEV